MHSAFFFIFSIMAILGGFFTIVKKNPLASAMSLTVSFLSVAGLYSLLNAPLLAIFQILVYAGAIMVLVIFVIMLVNQPDEEYEKDKIGKFRLGVGVVLGAALLTVLLKVIGTLQLAPAGKPAKDFGSIEAVGTLLFRNYLYPFEVISILLLIAIIGAVVLAGRHHGSK